MILIAGLLSLPASILLLSAAPGLATKLEKPWPYNLPSHVKYFPEHEASVRKVEEIHKQLLAQQPVGLRKMKSEDEMFFMDYWQFGSTKEDIWESGEAGRKVEDKEHASNSRVYRRGDIFPKGSSNTSSTQVLQPPFSQHSEHQTLTNLFFRRAIGIPSSLHSLLGERDFQCPTGTASCTSINRPNSCCATDETCQLITDTGLGDVGCCQQGQTCGQQVTNCQTGYQSCPGSTGGGCCIPGYTCSGVGCVLDTTTTTVVNPIVTILPSSSIKTSESTLPTSTLTSTTVVVVPGSTFTSTSTTSPSSTPRSSTSTTTSSSSIPSPSSTITSSSTSLPTTVTAVITLTSTTCSLGFRSCPATLGGGCCPTDRACGSMLCPASSTSTSSASLSAVAPIRPTSISTSTLTAPSNPTASVCPTGFYQCSAYYHAGCCQIGRDCGTTDCPASASTTAVNSNGVTIMAPTGTGGSCATGWFTCPAGQGGGCCPTGYACGASCTATNLGIVATGTAEASTVVSASGKGVLSGAQGRRADGVGFGIFWVIAVLFLYGMISVAELINDVGGL